MAETIFCLDIHEDKITAVSVDNSSGVAIVNGYGTSDLGQDPFPETLKLIQEKTGFTSGISRITFGAELFSYRTLSLPFTDKTKIEQVLPLEVADLSPVNIDSLAIDFVISNTTPEGVEVLAAMIDKAVFSDCLHSLNEAGIDPETIGISGVEEALIIAAGDVADFVLIDIGAGWATVIIVVGGNIALIRSIVTPPEIFEPDTELRSTDFALNIKQTLLVSGIFDIDREQYDVYLSGTIAPYEGLPEILSTVLEGVTVQIYRQSGQPLIKIDPATPSTYLPEEMDRALSLALRGSGKYKGFNFRKGDFKKRKSSSDYRSYFFKFGVPALVVLFSAIIYWGYTYTSLQNQQNALKDQITLVFKETLPEVTRIVNPVQQLAVKNKEIKATYSTGGLSEAELTTIELLAELSIRIPPTYKVTVVRLVADMDVIRIKAVTEDFNTVDNIQKELEKSPFFKNVSISSANQSQKGDEVSFELKIQRTL
ncbi:MAG: general secretion pathway protein L [Desulforhopalus sp.]|jgi:general secretion pathway protein L